MNPVSSDPNKIINDEMWKMKIPSIRNKNNLLFKFRQDPSTQAIKFGNIFFSEGIDGRLLDNPKRFH